MKIFSDMSESERERAAYGRARVLELLAEAVEIAADTGDYAAQASVICLLPTLALGFGEAEVPQGLALMRLTGLQMEVAAAMTGEQKKVVRERLKALGVARVVGETNEKLTTEAKEREED